MNERETTIQQLADARNEAKLLFTAGPASLLAENLTGLRPCFGRGDLDYAQVEERVLDQLKTMSGHRHIARMQGSASLALEIMALNFLTGRVLVIATGYYSDRLQWLAESCLRRDDGVQAVDVIEHSDLASVTGRYDWVLAVATETSCGLLLPIATSRAVADRIGARLMLDATASIGLEPDHERADVMAYSSCKGLFGLTGACFIAFNEMPAHEVDSFYLNLATHLDKRVTGPYHAIASLADVLPRHDDFRTAVVTNKARFTREMSAFLTVPASQQPLLCTHVSGRITAVDARAVLYTPRSNLGGSVVCHLGEAHLGRAARGDILNALQIAPSPVDGERSE